MYSLDSNAGSPHSLWTYIHDKSVHGKRTSTIKVHFTVKVLSTANVHSIVNVHFMVNVLSMYTYTHGKLFIYFFNWCFYAVLQNISLTSAASSMVGGNQAVLATHLQVAAGLSTYQSHQELDWNSPPPHVWHSRDIVLQQRAYPLSITLAPTQHLPHARLTYINYQRVIAINV